MAPTAVVVGAGIGGLTAAIALRQAGLAVLVLEKRDSVNEIGQALGIPSNAARVLQSFGLDIEKAQPSPWRGLDIVNAAASSQMSLVVRQENPTDPSAPPNFVHRQDFHQALADFVTSSSGVGQPVSIRYSSPVIAYRPAEGIVALASGEVLAADLVVASDGIRSEAHQWITEKLIPAQSSGIACLRFTVPTELLRTSPETAPAIELTDDPHRAMLYLSSDSIKCRALRYPCRSGTLQNFGVYLSLDVAQDSTNIQTETFRKDAAMSFMQGLIHPLVNNIVSLVAEDEMYLWKIADRDPLPNIVRGNMALVGDACHPMQPTLGQGAAMAIEDAGVLGVVLKDASPGPDIERRLKLYEKLRLPRSGSAQLLSRANLSESPWSGRRAADLEKAEAFMGKGNVPGTISELVTHFIHGDQLGEAREAVGRL